MSDNRRPRLQPVSRDTKFAKLKACSSFEEADRRLRLGCTFVEVARFVQEERQEYTDITHESMCDVLAKYYESIPQTEKALAVNGPIARKLAKQINYNLDEVEELEKLYALQMKRIAIGHGHEENMNMQLPNMGKEIFVAMKILNQTAQLKMDIGITKRQLGQLDINGQQALEVGERYGNENVSKVLSDPESRRKVMLLAEQLIKKGLKINPDAVITERQESDIIDVEPIEVEKVSEISLDDEDAE